MVSSLPLECFTAHMFSGLSFVIHWDSFIHPTSKHLLSTTECQAPLQAGLGLQEPKNTRPNPCSSGSVPISQWVS